MRRALALTASLVTLMMFGVVERAVSLDAQRADAVTELRSLEVSLGDAWERGDRLQGLVGIAEEDSADRAAVLEVRPGFVAELAALDTALANAGSLIDTTAIRASALSAQESVLAEDDDPAVVVAATATVRALTAKVDGDLAARRDAVGPGLPEWTSSGADGHARVRAALDRVGGAGVGLYESSSCAGGTAAACANSDGYIKYRADVVGWSDERVNWAMAHELAHIHQFQVWGALDSSSEYQRLFGGDPEFLANCMAVVRGFPGDVGCDADQQVWASGIWVGVVG